MSCSSAVRSCAWLGAAPAGGLQVELSVAQIELLRLVRRRPGLADADAAAQLLLTLSRDTVSALVAQPTAGRWPNVTAWTSTAAARRGCGALHGWRLSLIHI